MSSATKLVIAALWALSIVGAIFGTPQMPPIPFTLKMSFTTTATILLLPIVFFGTFSFFGPAQSPLYHPKLARFINTRYGEHACESFLVRLKPVLLFGVGGVLQGAVGLWQIYSSGGPPGAYVFDWFFISGGLAFMLAHLILYKRKAVGVFPTWALDLPTPPHTAAPPMKTTLRQALRTYWWTLIGIAVFPATILIGGEFFKIPFEMFIFPFFGVWFLAAWPCLSRKAPYSFWLVALGLWLVGWVYLSILMQLIHTFLA